MPGSQGGCLDLDGLSSIGRRIVNSSKLSMSRFIVGLILVAGAALIFMLGTDSSATAGAVALGVVGLASIAISQRKP